MHTFEQKRNQPQQQTTFNLRRSDTSMLEAGHLLHTTMHLQRSHSNRAVGESQATVNTPGAMYEQEADHVADQVMRMPEPGLKRACPCGGACPRCQDGRGVHKHLQTRRVPAIDAERSIAPHTVHEGLRSSGHPLDTATREFMEPRFGHDFSRVRVHTDQQASKSARALNASAYTVGQNIIFDGGRYAAGTDSGRRLLAHELAHVIQQQSNQASPSASNERMAVQRKLALQSQAENNDFEFFLTANDAANFNVNSKSHPFEVTLKQTPANLDDKFRFNMLKKIVDDPSEKLLVKQVTLTTSMNIVERDVAPSAAQAGGAPDYIPEAAPTHMQEFPSSITLATLKAGGITIPSKTLALKDPGYIGFFTGVANESWICYFEAHALAHEFGHAFLLFSGAPFQHGQQVPASAGITGPSGTDFTKGVSEFITNFVEELTEITDPQRLHTSPTRKQVWREPTPKGIWVKSTPMTWLEYKAKWPLARIKIKLVQNKMTNRLEKQVGVCNPTFDPGDCPP